jgi:hypothetical protein
VVEPISATVILAKIIAAASKAGIQLCSEHVMPRLLGTISPEVKERIVKQVNERLGEVASGWLEDWIKQQGKEPSKHRTAIDGVKRAVADSLLEAASATENKAWKQYLREAAKEMSKSPLAEHVGELGAATEIVKRAASAGERLNTEDWEQFLRKYAPVFQRSDLIELNVDDRQRGLLLHFAAEQIAANFDDRLARSFAKLGVEDDAAWTDLVYQMLRNTALQLDDSRKVLEAIDAELRLLKSHLLPPLASIFESRGKDVQSQLPFVFGRRRTDVQGTAAKKMLATDFVAFLDDERRITWWLWTGLEGCGKSRLALEACLAFEGTWKTGFVSTDLLKGLHGRWSEMAINGDYLLVFDDAGSEPELLRTFIYTLVKRAELEDSQVGGNPWKVRILLLERHVAPIVANDQTFAAPHWARELFPDDVLLGNQYPARHTPSFHLVDLDDDAARALARDYVTKIHRLHPQQPLSEQGSEELVSCALRLVKGTQRPLHIMIVSRVLLEVHDGTFEDFDSAMLAWLHRRVERRRRLLLKEFRDDVLVEQFLNLLCVATVVGKLKIDDVPSSLFLPPQAVLQNCPNFVRLFDQQGQGVLRALEPALVGEWFVFYRTDIESTANKISAKALVAVLNEIPGSRAGLKDFVRRTYRSFHGRAIPGIESTSTLWDLLRGVLGRYSTRFGEVFDRKMSKLLRGNSAQAEQAYDKLVFESIARASEELKRPVVVVDLMAGGSQRPQRMLDKFGSDIELLAIDRDDSRIRAVQASNAAGYAARSAEIKEGFSLKQILHDALDRDGCDVVVAKKALHELPWKLQQMLIHDISECLSPGGTVVLYTDGPVEMTPATHREWNRRDSRLKQILPMSGNCNMATARKELFPAECQFDSNDPSAPAMFINYWIRLKDWANYNVFEYEHRFFSSANQIKDEFAKCGLKTAGATAFYMQLQAQRFVEEAINRLDYMLADTTGSHYDLRNLFTDNPRYQFFWDFARAHLGGEHDPTEFGERMNATWELSGVHELLREEFLGESLNLDVQDESGPTFKMPIHIFEFSKKAGAHTASAGQPG